jgi:hypothetical protein
MNNLLSKMFSNTFHMERFNLKLNEVEGKQQHCAEVLHRFAALEDLGAEAEINSA